MVKVNEKVLKEILLDVEAFIPCEFCAFEGECGYDPINGIECSMALYKLLTEELLDK